MARPAGRASARLTPPTPSPVMDDEETTTGEGLHELVAELQEWRKIVGPAAEAIASFGTRLDALCKWLRSYRLLLYVVIFLVLQRTVATSPEDLPKLVGAVADAVRAVGGAS